MKNKLIISGPRLYTENNIIENASVIIHQTHIAEIHTKKIEKNNTEETFFSFPENYSVIPGLIDLHIHGINGKDCMDGTEEALTTISHALAKTGTTSFLATTMSADLSDIEKTLQRIAHFKKSNGAEMLGIHLEGPFLSAKRAGAQCKEKLLSPTIATMKQLQKISHHKIKLVTLAPELPMSVEFIRYLRQEKIIACMGHTDATYQESETAIDAGCTYATHLFNAMRDIHHREPGVVISALLSDKISVELIVDGIHLHPAMVELTYRLKGKDRIILVTDAMRAACLCDGNYELGGQSVHVKKGAPRLQNGTLAGSVLTLSSALQNMMTMTHCSFEDALKMATENPAKILGIFDKKGSIAIGKEADLVVLDEKKKVVLTVCAGEVAYCQNS